MKEIAINRKSWHYYLATKVAAYSPNWDYSVGEESDDICRYRSHVLGAILLIILAICAFYGVAFAAVQLSFAIVFSLLYHAWLFSSFAEAMLMVIVLLSVGAGICFLLDRLKAYRKHKEIERPDGFVKHAYKSWREKYCVKIKFTE